MSGAGLRIVRVVHVERDARGQVWLHVRLANGSTVQLEPSAVPAALKREFVGRVRSVDLGAMSSGNLLEDFRSRGREWMAGVLQRLSDIAAGFYEVERRADMAGRYDVATRAALRREEVRKVHGALYEIAYFLFPEHFDERLGRRAQVQVAALPTVLVGAVVLLAAVYIISAQATEAYIEAKGVERDAFLRALQSVPPEDRAAVVGRRFGGDDVWDTVAKVAVGVATGVAVAIAVPPVVRAIRGR